MASIPPPTDRGTYRPSGRAFLPAFLPLLAVALAVATGCATLIYLSVFIGMRLVIVTPLVLALPAAGMLYFACKYGKCRNRILAFLCGALVGAVVSPGRYHAELIDIVGLQHAHRVQLLPHYLELRMKTVTMGKAGAVNAGGPRPATTFDQIANWVIFSLEVGMIVLGCGILGVYLANQPFDEAHKRWMPVKTVILPSGASDGLAQALAERDMEKLAEQLDLLGQPTVAHCAVTIHYSPESLAEGEDAIAYISASEAGIASTEGARASRNVFEIWKLDPDEVRRIAPLLVPPSQGNDRA